MLLAAAWLIKIWIPIFVVSLFATCILLAVKKTRQAGKKTGVVVLLFGFFFFALLFGEKSYRMYLARNAITQSKPLTAALQNFKTDNGTYPHSLADLVPRYLSKIPAPHVARPQGGYYPYAYQSGKDSFELRFKLDGPPFGYHFIYCVNGDCPRFPHTLYFIKEIDGWGMYAKG